MANKPIPPEFQDMYEKAQEAIAHDWVGLGPSRIIELIERLGETDAKFERHAIGIGEFLAEMHAIMVDPVFEGKIKVIDMCKLLIDRATQDRALFQTLYSRVDELNHALDNMCGALAQLQLRTAWQLIEPGVLPRTGDEMLGPVQHKQRFICCVSDDGPKPTYEAYVALGYTHFRSVDAPSGT
jgi:hypothetical protein